MIKSGNGSPKKLEYIFAFISTSFVANMLINVSSLVTFENVSDINDFENAYIMHSVICFFINSILFIVSYNFVFKNLNFKKVIIYLYIFSFIGLIYGYSQLLAEFDKQGVELPVSTFQVIFTLGALSTILSILVISE
mgnify:CR=1 FL=1